MKNFLGNTKSFFISVDLRARLALFGLSMSADGITDPLNNTPQAIACAASTFMALTTAHDLGIALTAPFDENFPNPFNPYTHVPYKKEVVDVTDYPEVMQQTDTPGLFIHLSEKAVRELEEIGDSRGIGSTEELIYRIITLAHALVGTAYDLGSEKHRLYRLTFPDGTVEPYHPLFKTDGGDRLMALAIRSFPTRSDKTDEMLHAALRKRGPESKP